MEFKGDLWKLLPLLVLIVVSWVLSFVGSRLAKKRQQEQLMRGESPSEKSEEQFMDLEDEDLLEPSSSERSAGSRRPEQGQPAEWDGVQGAHPEPLTPEPIRPKWWGA